MESFRFRILPLCLILLGIATSLSALPAVPGSWSALGPDGGGIYTLVSSPTNPQILFASTTGGVYRSANGGATWEPSGQGLDQGLFVNRFAFDPLHPSTVYAGMALGLFKSLDGGVTWRRTALRSDLNVYEIAVHPQFPETVFVSTDQGIFQSNNGGARWKVVTRGLPATPYTIGVSFDPVSPRRLYASILSSPSRQMGLYRSLDGGFSWQPIHSGPMKHQQVEALAVDRRSARAVGTLYAGTLTGLFKSPDDGRTWTRLDGFDGAPIQTLAIHPTQRNVLYAGASRGLFRSTNRGQTWEMIQNLPHPGSVSPIVFSPQRPQTLYVGANAYFEPAGVYRSDDGGSSWALRSHGILAYSILSLAVDEQNPDTLWGIPDLVLFRSTDRGRTWAPALSGTAFSTSVIRWVAVSPLDSQTVYLKLLNGPVVRSQDGGQTWEVASAPDLPSDLPVLLADPQDRAGVWLAGQGIARSLDGGDTWTVLPTGPGFFRSLAISPSSPSTIYAFGDLSSQPLLVRSMDGGVTWTTIQNGLPRILNPLALAIDPLQPKTVYTLSIVGEVFKTTDGGDTWTRVSHGVNVRLSPPLLITDSGVLYATVPGDTIYESDDGGETWAPLGDVHLPVTVSTLAVDPRDPCRLYAGTLGHSLLAFTKTGPCR